MGQKSTNFIYIWQLSIS